MPQFCPIKNALAIWFHLHSVIYLLLGNTEEREGEQKKGKKSKKATELAKEAQDTFKMDVNDPRFSAVYDCHEYALDPSNPQYK